MLCNSRAGDVSATQMYIIDSTGCSICMVSFPINIVSFLIILWYSCNALQIQLNGAVYSKSLTSPLVFIE